MLIAVLAARPQRQLQFARLLHAEDEPPESRPQRQLRVDERPEGIASLSILLLQDLAVAPLLVILPLVAGTGPQSGGALGLLAAKATFGFGGVLAVGSLAFRYAFDFVAAARSTETFVAATLLVAVGMGQAAAALGLSASTGACSPRARSRRRG